MAIDVDLMIQAKHFWQRDVDKSGWTKADYIDYWRQTHRGEIIVVRETGWEWGRLERPPNFIKLTVTGITQVQADKFTGSLVDTILFDNQLDIQPDSVDIKERRFHVTQAVVDSGLVLYAADSSSIVITVEQAKTVIRRYDFNAIKQKIRNKLDR